MGSLNPAAVKFDLSFASPWLNAAGSLGFAPDLTGPVDLSRLGAFFTNPISLHARTTAHGERVLPFPGGYLLHTGHPNSGLRRAIQQHGGRWRRSPVPVIVHLLCTEPRETAEMVSRLENLEGVAGVELGLPVQIDAAGVEAFTRAAAGELPVIVRLPFEGAAALAPAAKAAGAAAVSLGPPRGTLPSPAGGLASGRLYGPALFPLALAAVAEMKRSGLYIIGAGGVSSAEQAEAMRRAGASAVQLDYALWRNPGLLASFP